MEGWYQQAELKGSHMTNMQMSDLFGTVLMYLVVYCPGSSRVFQMSAHSFPIRQFFK